jgi:hypothetical protein
VVAGRGKKGHAAHQRGIGGEVIVFELREGPRHISQIADVNHLRDVGLGHHLLKESNLFGRIDTAIAKHEKGEVPGCRRVEAVLNRIGRQHLAILDDLIAISGPCLQPRQVRLVLVVGR